MARGRQTRRLTPEQIERLRKFKMARHDGALSGYSLPQLRSAMAAPFSWETLEKALRGAPVWVNSHAYIVQWLDRFVPAPPLPVDGKSAAAGDGSGENGEHAEKASTDGTVPR